MGARDKGAGKSAQGPTRLLTAADEIALAARVQAGDRAARDELVLNNLGLVPFIARPYRRLGHREEDLIAVGYLGLIDAAERFDPVDIPGADSAPTRATGSRTISANGFAIKSSSVTRITWTGPGITTGTRARRN